MSTIAYDELHRITYKQIDLGKLHALQGIREELTEIVRLLSPVTVTALHERFDEIDISAGDDSEVEIVHNA